MKRHPAWLAVGLLVFVVLDCNLAKKNTNEATNRAETNATPSPEATGSGVIEEIRMARDDGNGDPGEETDTFSPSDRTIHCVVRLAEAKSKTKLKFSWWIVEAEGSENQKIKDIEYTTKALENVVHTHLTLPQDWPKGKYKVEVYVNGNLEGTVGYTVN